MIRPEKFRLFKSVCPRVAGLNQEDLAETTVQKKKKDKKRRKAVGPENVEMAEKGNDYSVAEETEVMRDSKWEQPKSGKNVGNSTMEKVVESVGRLKIKQRNTPVVKSGNQPASNQSKPPLEFPVVKSGGAKATSVSLGKSEIEMSSRNNRIANLSNDQIVQKGKAFSEMTEILGTDEEEDEDVEDSIVSGFVGTGRIKTDVTRKPCLNTVSEQNGSDRESLVSTFAKNSKVPKSSQSLPNHEMNTRGNSCDFCGTVYDDAKGLRRHMKAKHR